MSTAMFEARRNSSRQTSGRFSVSKTVKEKGKVKTKKENAVKKEELRRFKRVS